MHTAKEEGPEHARLVRLLIAQMSREGWEISHAVSDGYDQPDEVDGVIPDIVGWKGEVKAYGEAETCESLQSERSINQIGLLSGRSMQNGGVSVPLYLIVPRACYRDLVQMIDAAFAGRDILSFSG
jgi:hypothetical protein